MTRAEREDVLRLVRQREKVAKSAAAQRAAQLRSEFEKAMDTHFDFNKNEVWKAAMEKASAIVAECARQVQEECERLGIPAEFAPMLHGPYWQDRGENAVERRRVELRRLANKHIEASEKLARETIERECLSASTQIIAHGLGAEAKAFLDQMPTVDKLMPALDVLQIEQLRPKTTRDYLRDLS